MTTFIVMSYIIFVNPAILSFAGITGLESQGLPFDAVLASTCLVAGVMTIADGPLHEQGLRDRARARASTRSSRSASSPDDGLSFPEAMGLDRARGHRS